MKIGLVPMSAKPYHAGHHMLVELAAIDEITDEVKDLALPQNDKVCVFVSFSGRGVKKVKDPNDHRTIKQGANKIEVPKGGEVPVFGADMKHIWTNILKPNLNLSKKVVLLTPNDGIHNAPIKNVHEVCEALRDAYESGQESFSVPYLGIKAKTNETIINIYSDDEDITKNYQDVPMSKMYGELWKNEKTPAIRGIGVPRTSTIEISGSKMREYLCTGNIEEFVKLLPPIPDDAKKEIANILMQSIELSCPLEKRGNKNESLLRNYIKSIIFTD